MLVDERTLIVSPLLPVGGVLPSGVKLDVSVVGSGPNSGHAVGGGSPSMTRFDRPETSTGGPTHRPVTGIPVGALAGPPAAPAAPPPPARTARPRAPRA